MTKLIISTIIYTTIPLFMNGVIFYLLYAVISHQIVSGHAVTSEEILIDLHTIDTPVKSTV